MAYEIFCGKWTKARRAKLTEGDVIAILISEADWNWLASAYRVAASTISDIKRGNTWCHVGVSSGHGG